MRRAAAAAFLLAAALSLAPALAPAGAARAPGELWSDFPLEPPAATAPAQVEQPEQPRDRDSGEGRTVGVLILLGVVVAAGAGLVTRLRRGAGRPPPGREDEERRTALPHPLERPDSGGAAWGGSGAVAVRDRPGAPATTRTAPTLVESLSPHGRLADQLDERESRLGWRTHQVCEIACWRGYVAWQFYVEALSPLGESFSSPFFRARGKGSPEQTDAALRAHAVLVDKLMAAGWEPDGYGQDWFAERFQRANA